MDYSEMQTMIEEMMQDPVNQKIFLISMIASFSIVLILELVMYILGAVGVMHMPRLIFVIVTPLFFALSLVHVSVSVSKALITLGIGNAIVIKAVDVIMKVICAAIIVFDVVGFYFLLA